LVGIVQVGFIPFLFEGKKPWLRELDWQVRWVDAHLHQLSDGQRCHTGPDQKGENPRRFDSFLTRFSKNFFLLQFLVLGRTITGNRAY